jgi:hypothetical protein
MSSIGTRHFEDKCIGARRDLGQPASVSPRRRASTWQSRIPYLPCESAAKTKENRSRRRDWANTRPECSSLDFTSASTVFLGIERNANASGALVPLVWSASSTPGKAYAREETESQSRD